jgi:transcriptional regulator with XRE-family HTH domain
MGKSPYDSKLFNNEHISNFYGNIQALFAPFDKAKTSPTIEYFSELPKTIECVKSFLKDMEEAELFKEDYLTKSSIYDMLYAKLENIQANVLVNCINTKLKAEYKAELDKLSKKIINANEPLLVEIDKNSYGSFPAKLKELINHCNITQKGVAELIGLSEGTISGYINGNSYPDKFTTLLKLSNVLGCNVHYLIDSSSELPNMYQDTLYKDTGLTEISIKKLREINKSIFSVPIIRVLNILITSIDTEEKSEFDVLTAISQFLEVFPRQEKKYVVSEDIMYQYMKEFKVLDNIEDAKIKFQSFLKSIDSNCINGTLEKNILYFTNIEEKLLNLKREISIHNELESYINAEDYNKFLTGIEKFEEVIQCAKSNEEYGEESQLPFN